MRKKYCYLILCIACFILLCPFFLNLIPRGHDLLYHYYSIECLKYMIMHLNFSKISSIGMARNFGYGAFIFYPQLPHIICAIVAIFVDTLDALKIVYFIVLYLSGIVMFNLLKQIFKRNKSCLFGSLIYISTPYYINEIFVRCSLNEFFLVLFMPIVFLGLFNINKNNFYFYLFFIIGYVGIINSHLVLGVWFTIFVVIFLFLNYKEYLSFKNIKKFVLASIAILLICSPFLSLLIQHKVSLDYAVFSRSLMGASVYNIMDNDVDALILTFPLHQTINGLFYFVYVITFVFFIIGIFNLFKSDKKYMLGTTLFLLFFSFFFANGFAYQFYKVPDFLLNIQFAFRIITFYSFFGIFIVTYGFDSIELKKFRLTVYLLLLLSMCSTVYVSCNYALASMDLLVPPFTHNEMGYQKEYLTLKTVNNYSYFLGRSNDVISLNDSDVTNITVLDNTVPSMKFSVNNDAHKKIELELPRLYYLGYDITFVDLNGNKTHVDYKISKNGFIEITNHKSGTYVVKYKGTYLYRVCRLLSFITIIYLIILIRKYCKKRFIKA